MAVARKLLLPRSSQTYLITCTLMGNRKFFGTLLGLQAPVDHRPLITAWLAQIAACYCITIHRFSVSSDRLVMLITIDADAVVPLTAADLFERWNKLYPCDPKKMAVRLADLTDPYKGQELRARWHCLSWIMGRLCSGLTTRINRAEEIDGRLWLTRFQSAVLTDDAVKECADVMVAAGKVQQGTSHEDAPRRTELPALELPLAVEGKRSQSGVQQEKLSLNKQIAALVPRPLVAGRFECLEQVCADTKATLAAIVSAGGAFVQDLLDWICYPKQLFLGSRKSLLEFAERLLQNSIPVPKRLQRAMDEARLL
jgi:hypothetical protein